MRQATMLNGKVLAQNLRKEIAADVAALQKNHQISPQLAVILIGDHAPSHIYVRNKMKACAEVGITSRPFLYESLKEDALCQLIDTLNQDPEIDGILLQLPLPHGFDLDHIIARIAPEKDVDGFHPQNMGRLMRGDLSAMIPCTPQGCLLLIEEALKEKSESLAGQHAVVLGRSMIVGRPLGALLLAKDCSVTTLHSQSRDVPEICREADILIAAAGKPGLVKGDWVKDGAIVIDVGITRVSDHKGGHKIAGDVAADEVAKRAGFLTPVPGGVGPMTIAYLLANTVKAAKQRRGLL